MEAVSLGDVYFGVTGTKPQTPALLRKDLSWERLKKTNASSFIHIYRYVVAVAAAGRTGSQVHSLLLLTSEPLGPKKNNKKTKKLLYM